MQNFKNLLLQPPPSQETENDRRTALIETLKELKLENMKEKIKEENISFQNLLSMDTGELSTFVGPENKDKVQELWNSLHLPDNTRNVVE